MRNSTSFGMTWSGASSMSQWPALSMTAPSTSVATRRPCPMRNSPDAFSPASTNIGIVIGEAGKVRGVLLEGAEHFEACLHAAGLGIGRRIEPAVGLGIGTGGIGREFVPEVLDVDALAAVDE